MAGAPRAPPPSPAVSTPVTKSTPLRRGFCCALFSADPHADSRQDVWCTGTVHPGVRGVPRGDRLSWTLPCRSSLARAGICDRRPCCPAPADHLAPPAIQIHILPCVPKPALDSPVQPVIRPRRRSRAANGAGATVPRGCALGARSRRSRACPCRAAGRFA